MAGSWPLVSFWDSTLGLGVRNLRATSAPARRRGDPAWRRGRTSAIANSYDRLSLRVGIQVLPGHLLVFWLAGVSAVAWPTRIVAAKQGHQYSPFSLSNELST